MTYKIYIYIKNFENINQFFKILSINPFVLSVKLFDIDTISLSFFFINEVFNIAINLI